MTTGTELVAASDTGAETVPRRLSALRHVSIVAAAAPALVIMALTVHRTNVPSPNELDITAYRHGALGDIDGRR